MFSTARSFTHITTETVQAALLLLKEDEEAGRSMGFKTKINKLTASIIGMIQQSPQEQFHKGLPWQESFNLILPAFKV